MNNPKQYIIIIGEHPELSRKVQEELFKQSFKWSNGEQDVRHTRQRLIGINRFEPGQLSVIQTRTASDWLLQALSSGLLNGNELLLPSDILDGKITLEGGKPLAPSKVEVSITINGVRYFPETEV